MKMDYKDYYAALGVQKTASDEEIKKAYRKLARTHHPDLNPGDKAAEARFKEINEANEVLGDKEKRRQYDELGANWRQYAQQAEAGGARGGWHPGAGGAQYRTVSPEEMEDLFGGGGGGFSDFFQTFFSGEAGPRADSRRGRQARPRRGSDVEALAELTLEEAFTGTTRRVAVPRDAGDRAVEVRIPAGIKDGARVRAAGEGAQAAGGSGDLYLRVRVHPHPRFERRERDLHTRVAVPVTTAVLGGEVSVPTLSGSTLRLRIPELTQTGRIFRLRGHGMPAVGKPDERGDLYATVDVQIPQALNDEERRHYEALRGLASRMPGEDQ